MCRTNKNTPCNTGNRPFLLSPAGKDYLWGGNRLNDEYGKQIPLSPLAETWECSTHPAGLSRAASGEYRGKTLRAVLQAHPDYLGAHPASTPELPILIKLIDAKKDLSVQVHPDDAFARIHENGQLGKTELWYVLSAEPGARLVYGFSRPMTPDGVRRAVRDGTLEDCLNTVPVRPDDVFLIEAGTVHAIGGGVLIAEIQESSDLTYRLYDYDRLDKFGRRRELHLEKALQVADLSAAVPPRQPMRVLRYSPGHAEELIGRCRYFQVERHLLNTSEHRQMASLQSGSLSFEVLLCMDGCGVVFFEDEALPFFKGDCLFIPAESVPMRLHGKASFLRVSC